MPLITLLCLFVLIFQSVIMSFITSGFGIQLYLSLFLSLSLSLSSNCHGENQGTNRVGIMGRLNYRRAWIECNHRSPICFNVLFFHLILFCFRLKKKDHEWPLCLSDCILMRLRKRKRCFPSCASLHKVNPTLFLHISLSYTPCLKIRLP